MWSALFFTSPCVCDCVYDAVRTKSRSSVGERTRLPACHSEPIGEESRLVYFYFVLSAILRFAQDDKLGFVGVFLERTKYRIRVGRGLAPAAEFAVDCGTGKLQCERRGRRPRRPVVGAGLRARPSILM